METEIVTGFYYGGLPLLDLPMRDGNTGMTHMEIAHASLLDLPMRDGNGVGGDGMSEETAF